MAHLSYVNVFAKDVVALSGFYQRVFGFPEIEAIRSPIFRGLDTGKSSLGFNALDAYELLHLSEFSDTRGVKFLLNIDVDSQADVDRMVPLAVAAGPRSSSRPTSPITTGISRCCSIRKAMCSGSIS